MLHRWLPSHGHHHCHVLLMVATYTQNSMENCLTCESRLIVTGITQHHLHCYCMYHGVGLSDTTFSIMSVGLVNQN